MYAAAFKSHFWVSEQRESHPMKAPLSDEKKISFYFRGFVSKFEISAADQNLSLRAKILIKILNLQFKSLFKAS